MEQQNQLDEIARGLVELYSETDQTGGGKPPLAGLFTWSGGPAVPATATLEPGIAATIRVNPLIDPQVGGDPAFLRDGAANGDPDYTYNITGGAGFSDRLFSIANGFDQPLTFDPAAGLPANQSINGFAASTLNSLNAFRAAALEDDTSFGTARVLYLGSVIGTLGILRIGAGLLLAVTPLVAGLFFFSQTRGIFAGWIKGLIFKVDCTRYR